MSERSTRVLILTLAIGAGSCGDRTEPTRARAPAGAVTLGEEACLAVGFPLGDAPAEQVARARVLDLAAQLGVRVLRQDIRWYGLEPAPEELHWERFDAGIHEALSRGFELISVLAYGTPWASSATDTDPFYPPDDPADFARFAGRVAEHYGGIGRFEIWNEQNAGFRFWKPELAGDPTAYGALLRAASAAIHRVRPAAQVLYGGTFFLPEVIPGTLEFMSDHFAAYPDAAGDFDAVAFHPYPLYPPRVAPEHRGPGQESFASIVASLRELLDDHGAAKAPLVATELGWPSFDTVDRNAQANYLVRALLWLAAGAVERACWFTLDDGPFTGQFPPEDDFGLISWDVATGAPGSPKPAFTALQTLIATLGQTAFVREVTGDLGLRRGEHAFLLASADGSLVVRALWTEGDGASGTAHLPDLGGRLSAIDAMGSGVDVTADETGLRVSFGARPVYVIDTAPAK